MTVTTGEIIPTNCTIDNCDVVPTFSKKYITYMYITIIISCCHVCFKSCLPLLTGVGYNSTVVDVVYNRLIVDDTSAESLSTSVARINNHAF